MSAAFGQGITIDLTDYDPAKAERARRAREVALERFTVVVPEHRAGIGAAPVRVMDAGRPVVGLVRDKCAGCGHEDVLTEWDWLCDACSDVREADQ